MRDGHDVLSQGSRLVRADDGRRTEGLDGFQAPDETVLGGHALRRQRQADGHSGQETWRKSLGLLFLSLLKN